ncbi:MAG: PspC domain-containing protein [Bacteroidaceae bacterium]|nr:PspC domain-containing protein [Bacteroidaceae bacterium]
MMSEPKKMERPCTGRMLAGVCAAIANYVNLDATVVRVIYVLLTLLTSFCGLLVYFILMLVIPEAKSTFNINNDKK